MADLPVGSIVMFDGTSLPVGWYDCDGSTHSGIVTPNLIGVFPKGVLVSGGSLGATGGVSTHSHSNPSTAGNTHSHGSVSKVSSGQNGNQDGVASGSTHQGFINHTHNVTISNVNSPANHAHTTPNTAAGSSMPPYIRLRYIMRCE